MNRKTKLIAILFAFLMIAPLTLVAIPVKAAQYTNLQDSGGIPLPAGVTADQTVQTIAQMSFTPNPIGIGQQLLVNVWLHPPLQVSRYMKDALQVTFTRPDGTTDIVGPLSSYKGDTSAWFDYTPNQVGTWTIKFDFLGRYFPAGNYSVETGTYAGGSVFNAPLSVYYAPSSDGPYNLTVQQNMVASWPASLLPTDYWTRPISPENREWWSIAGNYPATGIIGGGPNWPADTNTYMSNYKFTPYVQAPSTAHIAWRRQDALYGLVGGTWGQQSIVPMYFSPNTPSGPNIVYDGRCYQTLTKPMTTLVNGTTRTVPTTVWESYDLRTGEVYWQLTDVVPPTMIFYENGIPTVAGTDPNSWGVTASLVAVSGGRMIKYDPFTGAVTVNVSIAPLTTGTLYMGQYFLSVQNLGSAGYRLINWTVQGDVSGLAFTNYRLMVMNNITWPFSSLGTVDYESGITVNTQSVTSPATGVASDVYIQGTSLTTGQMLWNVSAGVGFGLFSGSTSVADHGKYAVRFDDGYWYCWDLNSGNKLWKGELTSWPWGAFGDYGVQSYGGMIISNQYDGVAAYNWTNGKIVWFYQAKTQYSTETPYEGNYPWFSMGYSIIADGKLFTYNSEHTAGQPITRGWRLHAINITTGEGIWNITGSMAPTAVADGYLIAGNAYDGYMYVFGKGKSATTVSAPQTTVTSGTPVLIQGTVLDQSPAQPGTPCVSAGSMATYMEYLHMQKPIPSNFTVTGVPVQLLAIDPNGNAVNIGTATSDVSGNFQYEFTPTIDGVYKITATFAGDDAYGISWAETGLSVGVVPQASQTETAIATQTDYTMTIIAAAIGLAFVVVISVAIAVMILKKR